ncbi:transposase [Rhizobium redzepovicii]|uniref:transposase n=1 Tax=Rhizobium redzepovicii TaxID=2867518 RepID=UPI001C931CFB|nr:transposase [Rhizobium redzepovicii]MBY4615695.1 transposase [Rhizobium redzepovicii]
MESSLEFLTTRKSGREVHRHWPDEVKAQIVSESLRPGAMVNEVAERYGLRANRLSTVNRLGNGTPYRLPKVTPASGCIGSARVGPELFI